MATAKKATGKGAGSKTSKVKGTTTGRVVSKAATSGRLASKSATGKKSTALRSSATAARGTKQAVPKGRSGQWAYLVPPSPSTAGLWQPQQRAKFVVEAVGGTRRTADLLDVSPSQPSRWISGESVPGPAQARMLVDLEHVLTHALLVWADVEVVRDWLTSTNAHLDGARPVDWIRVNGTAEVVDALRAEAAGTYA